MVLINIVNKILICYEHIKNNAYINFGAGSHTELSDLAVMQSDTRCLINSIKMATGLPVPKTLTEFNSSSSEENIKGREGAN